MTQRIDHAEEARKILEDLEPHRRQNLELDSQLAQVHVTLALVEQQRIANLIAAYQMEYTPHKVVASGGGGGEVPTEMVIAQKIREGLGL